MKLEISLLNQSEIKEITEELIQGKEFFRYYQKLTDYKRLISEQESRIKGAVKDIMVARNVDALARGFNGNIANDYGKITYTFGREIVKETFDLERFKRECPDIYERYVTRETTFSNDSLKITPSKEIADEQDIR